ncbi:MAG: hypothetical protein Q8L48_27655 [Archangium sp.]|nr:hypothetical protein [Archangium sp.]
MRALSHATAAVNHPRSPRLSAAIGSESAALGKGVAGQPSNPVKQPADGL